MDNRAILSLNCSIPELKGAHDYPLWRWRVTLLLKARGWVDVISDSVEIRKRVDCISESNAMAAIGLSICSQHASSLTNCKTTYEIWKTLENKFNHENLNQKEVSQPFQTAESQESVLPFLQHPLPTPARQVNESYVPSNPPPYIAPNKPVQKILFRVNRL